MLLHEVHISRKSRVATSKLHTNDHIQVPIQVPLRLLEV